MSSYRAALGQEAFGHVPLFRSSERDEERIPLGEPDQDRVYYHMQDKGWRIQFGGTDRIEIFPLEQYDAANALFEALKKERGW